MKKLVLASAFAMTMIGPAYANCYGSASYKTCTDNNGNSYTIQKYGSTTRLNGYNAQTGNSWGQSTNRIGNSSYTTGHDANGNTWTENTRRIGNTLYQSGYDSDGRSYNGTIRNNGSYRTYQGQDSVGNYYHKTCNAYGCY